MFKKKHDYTVEITSIIFLAVLFFCWAAWGTFTGNDTDSYVNMDYQREMLYPLFLAAWRNIFGTSLMFKVAVLIQIFFTDYAVYRFMGFVTAKFELEPLRIIAGYALFAIMFIFPHFVTATGLLTFTSILSEGIAIPFFILFARHLMQAAMERSYLRLWVAITLAAVLSLTRSQFQYLFVACLIVGVVTALWGVRKFPKILLTLAMTAAGILVVFFMSHIYMFFITGNFTSASSGSVTACANILYVSDADDGNLIVDEGARRVFESTYAGMKDRGVRMEDLDPSGLIDRAMAVEEAHDVIKYEAYELAVGSYLNDLGIMDYQERLQMKDVVAMKIAIPLLKAHLGEWVKNYAGLCVVGLIRSVAASPENVVMQILTIVVLLVAVIAFFYKKQDEDIRIYMGTILLLILGNVCATSLVIMCLSRYMIYNFAIFYIGLMIALTGKLSTKHPEKVREEKTKEKSREKTAIEKRAEMINKRSNEKKEEKSDGNDHDSFSEKILEHKKEEKED